MFYITQIAKTLGLAKATIWYIPQKKECTSEFNNIKSHRRPWNTTPGRRETPSQHSGKSKILWGRRAYHGQSLQSRDIFMNVNTEDL